MAEQDLSEYARSLVADVQATAEAEGSTTHPAVFTARVLYDLEQAGVLENPFTAYHSGRGFEVYGYGVSTDGTTLDLFVTEFDLAPLDRKATKAQMDAAFKRLLGFARRCREGLKQYIDESSDVHDMCEAVDKALSEVARIRLFYLTNRICTASEVPPTDFDGLPVSREVWDLARLHRNETSGSLAEPIMVDFDPPLPCVLTPSDEPDHSVVLGVIPGSTLADLYESHWTRLLELNVRSFLQARGNVNRGIRETILKAPGRFLAYNNGITATATEVQFVLDPEGRPTHVSGVQGLQIVNGGQTTASLYYARARDRADLSQVQVQMKLTKVAPERLTDIVKRISEYSNTQNRVTQVDFSSNDAYHVDVQRYTRSLWAPAAEGSSQETHWFYERARGQYTDELTKAQTPARQKKFKQINPLKQKFTKADLAKYVHSWEQLPHLVGRGAQKNFVEFTIRLADDPPKVDVQYCRRVIAMAILFKAVDRIAGLHKAASHKSLVTTYTMARLSLAVDRRIDLDRIWHEQRVSSALERAIDSLCPLVMEAALRPLRGNNVGEWAKKGDCWDAVSRVSWTVPEELEAELRDAPLHATSLSAGSDVVTEGTEAELLAVPVDEWFAIARWAKETHNLDPWQRQLVQAVGRRRELDEKVPATQASQALHTRNEALGLGFRP
ncbi:AIPR family protein [Streptacidiphilus sp. MAP5-3]|uniref:AIPR family protein n=1 Tax=unclassified Streptacidiphilus TaxID=2643834 RepID=UPI003513E4F9